MSKLKTYACLMGAVVALFVAMPINEAWPALAAIKSGHFDSGKNMSPGSRKGKDKTLAELMMDLQARSTALEAAPVGQDLSVTFDQTVGAKTLRLQKHNRQVMVYLPSGSTADGGGAAITGATALPAAYRPSVDLVFPVVVTENAAKTFGVVKISSAGVITFHSSAAQAVFTDNVAAGWDAASVGYVSAP